MRIGVLQFAPKLASAEANIAKATEIIENHPPFNIDLLLHPELAFSGYNFSSKEHIQPFIENSSISSPSIAWAVKTALKYNCFVQLGFPRYDQNNIAKNSICLVSKTGNVVQYYDKHFLYSTDETWAESGSSFLSLNIPQLHSQVGFGICMDINPCKFTSPYSLKEFANFHLKNSSNLILLSNAWLAGIGDKICLKSPSHSTLNYWGDRLSPLLNSKCRVLVVIANCSGSNQGIQFCGSSCVLEIENGKFTVIGALAMDQESLLIVETS